MNRIFEKQGPKVIAFSSIQETEKDKAAMDAECKKVANLINGNAKKRMELLDKENHLGVELQGKYNEMEDLRRQEENRRQRLLKAKEELAAAELELENLPHYEPPKEEIERLKEEILNLQNSASQKRLEKSETDKYLCQKKSSLVQCMDRLREMDSKNTKCLRALRESGAERVVEAYKWVQDNSNLFNKQVYGPVLLEVNVSKQTHAAFLEGHVPYYIWKSFITQDSEDRDLLVKNLNSFDVPVLNYTGGDCSQREPFQISEDMRTLGIYSRLDEVFDAPTAVKQVLIGQFGLDHSYIGTRETDQNADRVQKLGIFDFWTPDNHYRWSKSRYGNHVSGVVEQVQRSRLLSYNIDAREIEKLRSHRMDLEESIETLEATSRRLQDEERRLSNEAANLRRQRDEINTAVLKEKEKRRDIMRTIELRKRKLESLAEEDDVDLVIAKLTDEARNCNIQRFRNAIKIKNLLLEAIGYRRSYAEKHMATLDFDAKIRELEAGLKQHEKLGLQASLQFETCKKETENCRQQLSECLRRAESIAPITPDLEKEFLEMPTTIEDLEAAIQDTTSQANSILFVNHNVLEQYENRERQIGSLATKLEEDKKEVNRCLTEVDALKGTWLPTLRNLVAQINETFSRNFKRWLLQEKYHWMSFALVLQECFLFTSKIPTGQLQVLSAHHQSGGERSVSTILYLVSLQDLANCPFRVVDEINQGMDPINERNMFQQLVRAASQPNTPQCFLLTPKLLPDLEYSEVCSILNVMNGPWIEKVSKVWGEGDRWGKIAGLMVENQD
ncbi:hypothetical protein K1719_012328 [Acacia pycnantha]|nr:hypothetical protein K1719_012328 [Acacia pycnantha]